jgi:hypothetical protein
MYDFDSSGDDAHGWRRIKEKKKKKENEDDDEDDEEEEEEEEEKGRKGQGSTHTRCSCKKNVRICSICGSRWTQAIASYYQVERKNSSLFSPDCCK